MSQNPTQSVSTGIPTLDEITHGGLPQGEIYIINGEPGTGKTILALHFLAAGVEAGEKVLCITLSQRTESVKQTAHSVGIDTTEIVFHELSSGEILQSLSHHQSVFDTSQQELSQTITAFTQVIDEVQPDRLVFDSISYIRMLANSPITYRRQLLMLRDFLLKRHITTLLTDVQDLAPGNSELIMMAHGTIKLTRELTSYYNEHRYLQVTKIRGRAYSSGKHSMRISESGMQVYPQLLQVKPIQQIDSTLVKTGVDELDKLLGEGFLTGTSCLIIGPAGTGKTSTASLFAHNFAHQYGKKASFFMFDELHHTFLQRSAGIGLDMNSLMEKDQVRFHELGLGDLTVGQFFQMVRHSVLEWGAEVVAIDTLTGYLSSVPTEEELVAQLHELLIFLNSHNVLSFLVVAQHGMVGNELQGPVDVSYLADAVLMLRHFEANGALRRAISVYKKRYGTHERGIRELWIDSEGIRVGELLSEFRGILSGTPEYIGDPKQLIKNTKD